MSNNNQADWDQTKESLDKLNTAYGLLRELEVYWDREHETAVIPRHPKEVEGVNVLKSLLAHAIRDLQQALNLK